MSDCVKIWLYLYVIDGMNIAQIARLYKTYFNKVKRAILSEYRKQLKANGYKQLTAGRVKRLFATADAGLVLAYHQCPRCASGHIKLIYEGDDDTGPIEGVRCGRCGAEISLLPSAFRLR